MAKSIAVKPKRGRPATGRDPFVGIRLPAPLLESIQAWSEKNDAASRSEAIRHLVEIGLKAKRQWLPQQRPFSA
jgi:Arc/MetJ-type ribon-helix-helix transcriptional regulator